MSQTPILTYPEILANFGQHLVPGRFESRAFLGWFLENYYRLDLADAQDAVCDGPDDKGIDGVYVNRNLEVVDVFQTKLYQGASKTLGDVALKEFAGTLDQLRDKESIERLAEETGNLDLRRVLTSGGVAEVVEAGYEVRGFFITNVPSENSAHEYMKSRPDVSVFDRDHLVTSWVAPGESSPVEQAVTFDLDGLGLIEYKTPEATVYMAALRATQLVTLAGLETQELFAWNVRQTLGKTKVNKAIADSVKDSAEHKNFLLYHNGLTVLAESVVQENDQLTIDGYSVVNGCQSLSTLYDNKEHVSDELRLLARIVRLPPQEALAAKITRHSNNQNSITARDLQSNSIIQRRLQTEFNDTFGRVLAYEIKRGERLDAEEVVTNEQAARLILAFDLEQPWTCHQSYRLFDELHSEIFARPEVDAKRIASIRAIHRSVVNALPGLDDQLVATYTLTQYFLLYLVKRAIAADPEGREFLANPGDVFDELTADKLTEVVDTIVGDLVIDLNAELTERTEAGNPFDHKRELKSATQVRALTGQIIPSYQKAIRRDRATSFSQGLANARASSGSGSDADTPTS